MVKDKNKNKGYFYVLKFLFNQNSLAFDSFESSSGDKQNQRIPSVLG